VLGVKPVTVAPLAPLGVTVAPAGETVNTALPPDAGLFQVTLALVSVTEATVTAVALTAFVVPFTMGEENTSPAALFAAT